MEDHEGKEKGGAAPEATHRKTRRATGPIAVDLQSFILKLHTVFRDCAELHGTGEMSTAEAFGFLADVMQLEYDKRLGHG